MFDGLADLRLFPWLLQIYMFAGATRKAYIALHNRYTNLTLSAPI